MKKRTILFLLFVVVFFGYFALRESRTIGYTTGDEETISLVNAISTYEDEHRKPPERLDMLVPTYLDAIRLPPDVEQIKYATDVDDYEWVVEFVIKDYGGDVYSFHGRGGTYIGRSAHESEID